MKIDKGDMRCGLPHATRARRPVGRTGALIGFLLCLLSISPGLALEPSQRQSVLIFYANETSQAAARSENYANVLAVLRRTGGLQAERAATSVLRDAERFPELVKRDLAELMSAAKHWKFDLAVFTNEMAFDRRYMFYRTATDEVETRKLPEVPPTPSTVLATSPLARPDVFRSALLAVTEQYPKDSLDAVLIADSHGSGDMALIPRVNADLSGSDAAREMQQLLESDDNGVPPDWAELQGTSKLDFWQTIRDVSTASGVRFPLVFREACASGLRSWREYDMFPGSVALFAHSAMGELDSANISYAKIFSAEAPNPDWLSALLAGLSRSGVHVDSQWTIWLWVALITIGSIPSGLFFIPLAAWLIWYVGAGLAARRRTDHAAVG
jgi:hypothetical protein